MAYEFIHGGSGDDELLGGDGWDIIAGGGGDDTLRGQYDDDWLYGEGGDDNLNGGVGNDHLYGGTGFDELHGSYGHDVLYYSGAGIYEGGDGSDTFDAHYSEWQYFGYYPFNPGVGNYADEPAFAAGPLTNEGLLIDLESNVLEERGTGAATEDFYAPGAAPIGSGDTEMRSIEAYNLTDFGDYFAGDNTPDSISGNGGDDIIEGRGGADYIHGGDGSDTVEYGSAGAGVDVDLERGTGLMSDAEGDTYERIENIRGTSFVDALYGNDAANTILGRAGIDFLEGRGGADVLDGGAGEDTVMYTSSAFGVNVNLARTTEQFFGDAAGDILRDIEHVWGSDFGDVLTGDNEANRIEGRDGTDFIDGGFGNDTLFGMQGVDTVRFMSWDPTGL